MTPTPVDWPEAIKPLLKKYKGTKHPLEANNSYQLVVMVILAMQSSDNLINKIAPGFFQAYPNMQALSKATGEDLHPYLSKVINFRNKANWLVELANAIKTDSKNQTSPR